MQQAVYLYVCIEAIPLFFPGMVLTIDFDLWELMCYENLQNISDIKYISTPLYFLQRLNPYVTLTLMFDLYIYYFFENNIKQNITTVCQILQSLKLWLLRHSWPRFRLSLWKKSLTTVKSLKLGKTLWDYSLHLNQHACLPNLKRNV